jgi:transposase-like protein
MKAVFHREEFMAAAKSPTQRAPRRHLPPAEKRRIVELTLVEGASVVAIAHEHGVHPNSLSQWKALYRAGKLDAPAQPRARVAGPAASATFVPVSVAPEVRKPQAATRSDAAVGRSGIVQLVLASGATLRIETTALDAALVCALVAELQR